MQPICTSVLAKIYPRKKWVLHLINWNKIASYAKHAKVTHAICDITSCHD
jgi:hypothetical protein